jgi:5-methyltetrahydrofolate--homocysteine methyltransferase
MTSGDEAQDMDWATSVLQSAIPDISICIDSPNYVAIERALKIYNGSGTLMINSITGEEGRIKSILPLALKYRTKLVALTMDDKGMPDTADDRARIARHILETVSREGFPAGDLYFDPLIRPISTEPGQGWEFLKSIPKIKELGPVNTICGLSNISYGLPNRAGINASFLAMAIAEGLDAAIIDPTEKKVSSAMYAALALAGRDEYCAGYIGAFRQGRLS